MTAEPRLPDDVTLEETESFLDRVALAITANPDGPELLPLYEWLERQLEMKKRQKSTMASVLARVANRQGHC